MKNSSTSCYSYLVNLRWGLEFELRNSIQFYEGEDREVVESYIKKRIIEIKEEEQECLKIQAS